jgi:uncharacterized protein (DUF1015 family)
MAVFKPFCAYRPNKNVASLVAALPYDVMNSAEARMMAEDKPLSFLHVDRAEIDLDPSVDIYSDEVYERAASNLNRMLQDGTYVHDEAPRFYIYRLIMDGRSQTGVVGCASIDDYLNDHIKKHELTRAEKEEDRVRHVDTCNANTGPIFLTYRGTADVSELVCQWAEAHEPEYDFTAEDGVRHMVWVVDDGRISDKLEKAFGAVPDFYIADGHHRAASAVRVGLKRREAKTGYTGEEDFNYFLAVIFPDEELSIWDYNRVVDDLRGMTQEQFLTSLARDFTVEKSEERVKPDKKHCFGMYLGGKWYRISAKPGTFDEGDPVGRLDVSILQQNLLTPLLGIGDPRKDGRIQFVGGIRGLEELERLVDGGKAVAFSMYPTTTGDLMDIADSGRIMPPKSTWFEPKLRSGLFIHTL